jgi:hypothetical protein
MVHIVTSKVLKGLIMYSPISPSPSIFITIYNYLFNLSSSHVLVFIRLCSALQCCYHPEDLNDPSGLCLPIKHEESKVS